jgi:predicted Ser/Thr protein kinase
MTNKKYIEDFGEIEDKGKRLEALINLSKDIQEKERRIPYTFNDFLYNTSKNPRRIFRDIFHIFYDMVHHFVPEGIEEYPDSKESVGYVHYDCKDLFVTDCDFPFFADRLFANRFMNMIKNFSQGIQQNYIFLFEGPPGSGKSTFLNNLLLKLENYTRTHDGAMYESFWRLDVDKLGGYKKSIKTIEKIIENSDNEKLNQDLAFALSSGMDLPESSIDFSCPRHDHPILQIPKEYRKNFLDELIMDEEFKNKLFTKKQFEWVLKASPCNICQAVYSNLMDTLGDPLEVFSQLYARRVLFNRQLGEGISVFNPGDQTYDSPIRNSELEKNINRLFLSNDIDFTYSALAKTNNGVLALMDIKENNISRLMNLHGIISDGVHKVRLVEEHIKSIFVGLVNPEDRKHYENVKSFQDRIINVNIPYILDYNTEVSIYKNKFGEDIEQKFLPRVLKNFAKIIISTRMDSNSPVLKNWIKDPKKYEKYLDKFMLLLKMDIYSGIIPSYLSEEDFKAFNKETRKAVLDASENEGKKGISGRQSLNIFGQFISKFIKKDKLITMDMIIKFFKEELNGNYLEAPDGFIDSLEDMYDYNVLQEIKEAIYFYNESQIEKDIQNYLFAINFDAGTIEKNNFTGDKIEITEEFFTNFENIFLGSSVNETKRKEFRKDAIKEYISKTLAQEIRSESKKLNETSQYRDLFKKYTKNLKENVLVSYKENDNFRRAISDFGKDGFRNYDSRLQGDVKRLIKNLNKKFGYSEKGAKQVALYVIDKKLFEKY